MHAGGSVIFSDGWGAIDIWGKKLVVAVVVLGAVCVYFCWEISWLLFNQFCDLNEYVLEE